MNFDTHTHPHGASPTLRTISVGFEGLHSSTQAELVGLRLACRHLDDLSSFRRITSVADSQPALLSLCRTSGASALAVEVRCALQSLRPQVDEMRIWWTPSHVDLVENDLADEAAKAAALSDSFDVVVEPVPVCRTALRSLVHRWLVGHVDRQWALCDRDRDLFSVMPSFAPSLSWTDDLSRREVALVAQFLTGHYASNAYLFQFGSREDPHCDWCEAAIDDRRHRLFSCPRFSFVRQRLTALVESDSRGAQSWTWAFLTGPGRCYLARFLLSVQIAVH